jgi:hypothetical protein
LFEVVHDEFFEAGGCGSHLCVFTACMFKP